MKRLVILLVMGLVMFSCGEDPIPPVSKTPEQLALELLSGTNGITYTLGTTGFVKRNGVDETNFYPGLSFKLVGSGKSYTVTGGDDLFDSSGTWSFIGSNYDKIKLSGSKPGSNVEISFTKTGQDLTLSFSVPSPPGGRITALVGSYQIRLVGG